MTHKEIAQHIHDKYDISGWWAQMVTVGYERIKGLRDVGQRRGGTYDANKSKTFPVEVARLYRAFSVARTRSRWLPGVKLVVTSATPSKSMRIKWDDGTAVEANFTDKGQKSQVALQHRKLPSKAEAEKRKAFWGDRLEALKEILG
jgi:uncharacterized protein YndB with AHSA1/START domain